MGKASIISDEIEININSFSDPLLLQLSPANSVEIQWQNPIEGVGGSVDCNELLTHLGQKL